MTNSLVLVIMALINTNILRKRLPPCFPLDQRENQSCASPAFSVQRAHFQFGQNLILVDASMVRRQICDKAGDCTEVVVLPSSPPKRKGLTSAVLGMGIHGDIPPPGFPKLVLLSSVQANLCLCLISSIQLDITCASLPSCHRGRIMRGRTSRFLLYS